MIRGCIENISPRAVRGWIHADGRSLRDAPLLAFVGPECIGAGQVSHFRQDLADAGLGDGYLGFEIPIAGERAPDLGSVVVRLDGSDAVLVQPQARIVGNQMGDWTISTEEVKEALAQFRFMLAHSWIDQADYDFLKAVTKRGLYEQALPRTERGSAKQQFDALQRLARQMFAVQLRREVDLQTTEIGDLDAFREVAQTIAAHRDHPVVMLTGGDFTVHAREGGHIQGSVDAGIMDNEFRVANYQAIYLDVRCAVSALEVSDSQPLCLTRVARTPQ